MAAATAVVGLCNVDCWLRIYTELIWNHKDHWFEMDMVKDSNMRRVLEGATSELGAGDGQEGNTSKRGATSFPQLLWPDAQVPYIFDGFVG